MRTIDGVSWRTWLWIAVRAVLFGGALGAVVGGLDMATRVVTR